MHSLPQLRCWIFPSQKDSSCLFLTSHPTPIPDQSLICHHRLFLAFLEIQVSGINLNVHLKRMCVLLFGGGMFKNICKSTWSNVLFKVSVLSLIFCLDDLSIDISGGVQVPLLLLCYCQFLPLCLLIFALCI